MKIKRKDVGSVSVLYLHGKLTGQESYTLFHEALDRLLEESRHYAVLNLEFVPWVDSSGVAALMGGYFAFVRGGGHLKLTGLLPRVDDVFFTLDLRHILDVYDTEAEAIASYSMKAG